MHSLSSLNHVQTLFFFSVHVLARAAGDFSNNDDKGGRATDATRFSSVRAARGLLLSVVILVASRSYLPPLHALLLLLLPSPIAASARP